MGLYTNSGYMMVIWWVKKYVWGILVYSVWDNQKNNGIIWDIVINLGLSENRVYSQTNSHLKTG